MILPVLRNEWVIFINANDNVAFVAANDNAVVAVAVAA